MIKRANIFHQTHPREQFNLSDMREERYKQNMRVSVSVGWRYNWWVGRRHGRGGRPPENYEFGRCDFLYSGGFWGWPLPIILIHSLCMFIEPTYIDFIFSMLKCIFNMSIILLNLKYNTFVLKETTTATFGIRLFFSAEGSHK